MLKTTFQLVFLYLINFSPKSKKASQFTYISTTLLKLRSTREKGKPFIGILILLRITTFRFSSEQHNIFILKTLRTLLQKKPQFLEALFLQF